MNIFRFDQIRSQNNFASSPQLSHWSFSIFFLATLWHKCSSSFFFSFMFFFLRTKQDYPSRAAKENPQIKADRYQFPFPALPIVLLREGTTGRDLDLISRPWTTAAGGRNAGWSLPCITCEEMAPKRACPRLAAWPSQCLVRCLVVRHALVVEATRIAVELVASLSTYL